MKTAIREGDAMKNKAFDRIKNRLDKQREAKDAPMVPISMRLPASMIEELKEIAQAKGFSGYQGLIRYYVSAGMRADLEELDRPDIGAIARALKESGVSKKVIDKALDAA
jgi:predicted DNA binding CopG/RHH family protein